MATHSSTLAWRIPMDSGAWQETVHGVTKELDTTEHTVYSKDLLYNTGNSTQYSVMTYMGKESKKEWMYVYIELNLFAVQLKLTQHCKSTIHLYQLHKR